MIERINLIELLNNYGINGKKLINNNSKVLEYGNYKDIEDVVKFLLSKNFTPNMIEKCPSIIAWTNVLEIENNYNWIINETNITFNELKKCLHILGGNLFEMKKIYDYVTKKYGINTLKNCLTILQGNYDNIVSLTETLESTIGLNIVKNNGGSILYNTTSEELLKILTIPEFKYNKVTKTYNENLLTPTTFFRDYQEIVSILKLDYWKEDKFKLLLSANLWNRNENQIKEILELDCWNNPKYKVLLVPSIWKRDASQVKAILSLPHWDDSKYISVLAPTIWNNTEIKIKEILELKYIDEFGNEKSYWDIEKFQKLLTPTIWRSEAKEIKEILSLSYWNDSKFESLLTPSIWMENVDKIKEILALSYWGDSKFESLLTPTIWKQDAIEIEKILNLSCWNEERFKKILTPSIWKRSAVEIEEILSLPYWQDEKYNSLLVSTIWDKTAIHIIQKIEFCKNDKDLWMFDNNPTLILKITINELITKTNYLRFNNIPVVINGKINSIYGMSNIHMQKKYGISKKELVRDYLYIEEKKKIK